MINLGLKQDLGYFLSIVLFLFLFFQFKKHLGSPLVLFGSLVIWIMVYLILFTVDFIYALGWIKLLHYHHYRDYLSETLLSLLIINSAFQKRIFSEWNKRISIRYLIFSNAAIITISLIPYIVVDYYNSRILNIVPNLPYYYIMVILIFIFSIIILFIWKLLEKSLFIE